MAAKGRGGQLGSPFEQQSADSPRPIKLVRSQRQRRHAQGMKVDGDLADGLHRVEVNGNTARLAFGSKRPNILDDAGFIVRENNRNKPYVIAFSLSPLLRVSLSAFIAHDIA